MGRGSFFFVLGVRFHIVITKGQAPREGGYMARGVIFFVLGVRFHIFITRGQAPIEGGLQGGGGVIFLFRGSNTIFSLQRVKHQ